MVTINPDRPVPSEVGFLFDLTIKIMTGDPRSVLANENLIKSFFPYLDSGFESWEKGNYANDDIFISKLGRSIKVLQAPPLDSAFDFYFCQNINVANEPEKEKEFQNRIASICITWAIDRISKTDVNDKKRLAGLLTALQLISTNLKFANDPMISIQKERDEKYFNYFFPPSLLFNLASSIESANASGVNNSCLDKQTCKIVTDLFYGHYEAFRDGMESQRLYKKNLLDGFFSLLQDHKTQFFYGNSKDINLQIFVLKYYQGLVNVATAIKQHEKNGTVYLTDHLEKILEKEGKLPKDGQIYSIEEWKNILLSLIDNSLLFNFLKPDNKVREIIGRYDYRALIGFLKSQEEKSLLLAALGFGKLGVVTFELSEALKELGINLQIFPVDILPLEKIGENYKDVLIGKYLRTSSGVFQHTKDLEIPDEVSLTPSEIEKIVAWRDEVWSNNPIGAGINLVGDALPVQEANLVTLQGTAACEGIFARRVRMIENSLHAVLSQGGIFLLEGGMTSVNQNVLAIALHFYQGKITPLYINIRGRVKSKKDGFSASNLRLLENNGEELSKLGENYFGLSFDNSALLLSAVYQSIDLSL